MPDALPAGRAVDAELPAGLRPVPYAFSSSVNVYAAADPVSLWICAVSRAPCVREFGAFKFAPGVTPTPSRSTNSPPSQPPSNAPTTPINDSAKAAVENTSGELHLNNQLAINKIITQRFVRPCSRPILAARVPEG